MEYIPLSFIFGILTVLSPCVLPVLPTILGGTLGHKDRKRTFVIIASLAVSVIIFSIFLKSSLEIASNFAQIPDEFWFWFSGGVIIVFGMFMLFPEVWDKIALRLGFTNSSDSLLNKTANMTSWFGPVLLGASLGPIFTSCSPTYAIITKTLILDSFFVAFINIIVYTVGLSIMMLIIAIYGQIAVKKLKWAANPKGWFRKGMGGFMIILGILIAVGIIKDIETFLLEKTPLNILRLETAIIEDRLEE